MSLKPAPYTIEESKQIRLIIDTDINCEADDHYAVIHAILTPKFEVKGVLAEHFGPEFNCNGFEDSENQSYEEAKKLIKMMGLEGEIPVLEGCKAPIKDRTYVDAPAVDFIIEEAMREDEKPLFIINQGALTNLASALLKAPEIASRMTAVWIGGGAYPNGGFEFNLNNDPEAANVVLASDIELWQVPASVYGLMKVSLMTLYDRVYPCGEVGRYITENVYRISKLFASMPLGAKMNPTFSADAKAVGFPNGEVWHMGDSAGLGVLLSDHEGHFEITGAPQFDISDKNYRYILNPDNERKIRVYNYVDSQFIMEDFYAKLKYHFGDK